MFDLSPFSLSAFASKIYLSHDEQTDLKRRAESAKQKAASKVDLFPFAFHLSPIIFMSPQ